LSKLLLISNTIDMTSKKSTKLKTIEREFIVIISTTLTILRNSKKIATLKELTILKKSIKLKETRIEDIQFILKKIVYFQDKKNKQSRLCISKAIKAKIFKLSYNA